ncbi:MAG: hypothetical protein KC613_04875 [Myxococcales bacterium]|nr:hypothetical protein [Myxococcales bacterium]MCB9523711.1 hypothetical protein [Myxococcales bacterium]
MLRRLLLLLVVGALSWAGLQVWRRFRLLAPPTVPQAWRALAERDPVLADALDLRDRLSRLAKRAAPGRRASLLREVHRSLEALVGLVQVRLDLTDYLAGAKDGDAQVLAPRVAGLATSAEAARDGLRAVYGELLAAYEQRDDGGEAAVSRTQGILEDLRDQAAAEHEVRAWLAERAG